MKILLLSILIGFSSVSSAAMKKCQDSEGKWHYGDTAVKACENSKITTLTKRGFIDSEQSPPKSAQQIEAEREQAELLALKQAQEKAERDERLRILSIYETEQDIDRQRDNKLNAVNRNIDVHDAYIKGMETRIARYQTKLEQIKTAPAKKEMQDRIERAKIRMADSARERKELLAQRDKITLSFEKEKELYLKLKNGQ